jgi:hypothetical protein
LIPEILLLVEQIRPRAAKIYDLWTAISILFQPCAFKAVKGVGDSFATANDTFVLVIAKGAFVANAHQRGRSYIAVAYGTLSIALVAEPTDGNASLFATHNKIARKEC